jgi:hypothetical protein
MTGVLPVSGVGNLISGSTAGGGQITPSECASRLLRLSGGDAGSCGSPEPVVGDPGAPGGDDGEQGAEPGMAGEVPCPGAGAADMEARMAAANSAAISSQNFRMARHVFFMPIQPAAHPQGSAPDPLPGTIPLPQRLILLQRVM